MRSVVERNVVMRRITVLETENNIDHHFFSPAMRWIRQHVLTLPVTCRSHLVKDVANMGDNALFANDRWSNVLTMPRDFQMML